MISWKGGIVPSRLILVGIGIGAFLSAATTWVTLQFPIEQIRPAIVWTMGSVYGSDWGDVQLLGISLLVLGPLAVMLMWYLRVLQLGDDIARGLGMHLELTRLALIVVGCGLAAVAVSVAGPIGFVALMVPARGPDAGWPAFGQRDALHRAAGGHVPALRRCHLAAFPAGGVAGRRGDRGDRRSLLPLPALSLKCTGVNDGEIAIGQCIARLRRRHDRPRSQPDRSRWPDHDDHRPERLRQIDACSNRSPGC